ncbi:MAG: branched-chain amino acid ABC transporter permease, partial [Actinobacteria bacterium]|nr:branched-chain amino acid ABC transporter permease [Actinomycetota bacterium]
MRRAELGFLWCCFVALAAAPFWAGEGIVRKLVAFLTVLAMVQLWNLMAGFGGVVSVGQQAYVGIGAYAMWSASAWFGIRLTST